MHMYAKASVSMSRATGEKPNANLDSCSVKAIFGTAATGLILSGSTQPNPALAPKLMTMGSQGVPTQQPTQEDISPDVAAAAADDAVGTDAEEVEESREFHDLFAVLTPSCCQLKKIFDVVIYYQLKILSYLLCWRPYVVN